MSTSRWSGRPKLLFVTYTFPPAKFIGSVRTWNMAKYLARSGWSVTVLTLNPSLRRDIEDSEATKIHLEQEGIKRILTDHYWRWLAASTLRCPNEGFAWVVGGICRRMSRSIAIEPSVGWVKAAERACSELTMNDVDIILASAPSFSAFSVAQRLAKRLRCPYVVDYRDLWSRNLHNPSPLAARKEGSVLADSAGVTIVSPAWGLVLDRHFKIGPKLHIVSNGYDAEEMAAVQPHDFGHFAIVYTGVFYPPKRVISPVMAALRRLDENAAWRHEPWRFHYYGKHEDHVLEEAERFGITDRVIVHGNVHRSEALAAVKGAGAAVVITSVIENPLLEDKGMVTGKIFEAIGLGTPILLIAPADSDASVIAAATGVGGSFAANDVNGIASFLSDLMNGDSVQSKDSGAYAWDCIVTGLDRILRQVIGR